MKMGLGNCLLPERWKTQRDVSLAAFWLSDPGCPHQHLYCLSLTYSCTMTGMLRSSSLSAVHAELFCLHLPSHSLCHFLNLWLDNILKDFWYDFISDCHISRSSIAAALATLFLPSSTPPALSSGLYRGEEEAHKQQYFFPPCWGGS